MSTSRSKWVEAGLKLALLVLSLGLTFGAMELALRVAHGGANPYQVSKIVQYDKQLGWTLAPGKYEFFNVALFNTVRFQIGELGLRTTAALKPPHRRATVIGDSFVFSEGLSDGEVFTDILQTKVGPELEIVNAGVPGFGTGQQTLLVNRLRERGFDLGQKVLLVFFTNDIADNAGIKYGSMEHDPAKPVFEVRGDVLTSTAVPPWPRWEAASVNALVSNSIAYMFIRSRLEIIAANNPWIVRTAAAAGLSVSLPREPGIVGAWYSPSWEDRWRRTDAILDHFARSVQGEGRELVIAFMPSPFQVEKVFEELIRSQADSPLNKAFLADMDRPQRVLREFCEARRLRFVDLTPPLRAHGAGPVYFLREGHLNAVGSAIVANALVKVVAP
jgi:hypothetical protein